MPAHHNDEDDEEDNEHLNKLIRADNTHSFNKAVFDCHLENNRRKRFELALREFWHTYRKVWIEAVAVFIVHITTMICYPGIIL